MIIHGFMGQPHTSTVFFQLLLTQNSFYDCLFSKGLLFILYCWLPQCVTLFFLARKFVYQDKKWGTQSMLTTWFHVLTLLYNLPALYSVSKALMSSALCPDFVYGYLWEHQFLRNFLFHISTEKSPKWLLILIVVLYLFPYQLDLHLNIISC